MITDTNNDEITYIPIELQEGGESLPVIVRVFPDSAEDVLTVDNAPDATIWAKIGAGAWFDLAVSPVDLEPYFESFLEIQLKAIAAEDVPGLSRVELFLGVRSQSPAAWLV